MTRATVRDDAGREMWHNWQCAIAAGIETRTWTGYVNRGQAPAEDGRDKEDRPVWYPETVTRWLTERQNGRSTDE